MHKIKLLVFYKIACGASQLLYEIAGQRCIKACMIFNNWKSKKLDTSYFDWFGIHFTHMNAYVY